MSPLVSVVIPAYNASRTIGEAVSSVLDGSFQDFEIIVCDDASNDRTADVVRSIPDPRINLLRNKVNMGEGATRDRAIAAANGNWIAPLDADDAFAPERLRTLLDVAMAHPRSIVFDEVMICHDTPSGIRAWRPARNNAVYPGQAKQIRRVQFTDWVSQRRLVMQPIIPTQLIRELSLSHSDSAAGADIGFRCKLLGRSKADLWYVPEALYLYRTSPSGMSGTSGRDTLLANELESAVAAFRGDEAAIAALRARTAYSRRAAEYRVFFSQLSKFNLVDAARVAWRKPWMIGEFTRRAVERIPYHFSRIRQGGLRRKSK
jgi:glycosyltransferase involved in cell wall biosynthesis